MHLHRHSRYLLLPVLLANTNHYLHVIQGFCVYRFGTLNFVCTRSVALISCQKKGKKGKIFKCPNHPSVFSPAFSLSNCVDALLLSHAPSSPAKPCGLPLFRLPAIENHSLCRQLLCSVCLNLHPFLVSSVSPSPLIRSKQLMNASFHI